MLFSSDAGVVRASAALEALEQRVTDAGGVVHWNTPVSAVEQDADGVRVATSAGVFSADAAVVTAGARSDRLVPSLPPLRVTEETPAHFASLTGPWPSFNHFIAAPAPVYGMPTPGEGIKVGFHGVGAVVDPDRRPHVPTRQAELREYVREWMPGLDPDSAVPISCTYTSTLDDVFVLDRIGRIIVGVGFSGHGFKFAPGVGAVLADLALDPAARAAAPFRLS